MSYTNIKKEAKAAVLSRLNESDTGFTAEFLSDQKIKEFSNIKSVKSKRVLIGASAQPTIVGAVVIGWLVDVVIQVASDFNKVTEVEHEAMCAAVEAFIEDKNNTTELTNSKILVQVATPGVNPADDFVDGERVSEYHLELDCLLRGVV